MIMKASQERAVAKKRDDLKMKKVKALTANLGTYNDLWQRAEHNAAMGDYTQAAMLWERLAKLENRPALAEEDCAMAHGYRLLRDLVERKLVTPDQECKRCEHDRLSHVVGLACRSCACGAFT